ncbi:UTRA domain-containing protein [Pseudonocardia artemisiae]
MAARAPQEREVRGLNLAPGEPVVSLRRIAFDEAGEPVEVFESVVAADRHVFVYEFSADY